jgi:hypothetical protein
MIVIEQVTIKFSKTINSSCFYIKKFIFEKLDCLTIIVINYYYLMFSFSNVNIIYFRKKNRQIKQSSLMALTTVVKTHGKSKNASSAYEVILKVYI